MKGKKSNEKEKAWMRVQENGLIKDCRSPPQGPQAGSPGKVRIRKDEVLAKFWNFESKARISNHISQNPKMDTKNAWIIFIRYILRYSQLLTDEMV